MMIKNIEEIIIYESPDGGKTVYSRKSGAKERMTVIEDPEKPHYDRWYLWKQILLECETNTALADIVKQAEMVYQIVKDEKC
jgi:hypothetical protein